MLIVGLTGGIACGKSTVSDMLKKEHNITIIDADLTAREVVQPGETTYNQIVQYFHEKVPGLLNEDKTLNRPVLGAYVFNNKDELQVLNSITHPAVRKRIFWKLLCSCTQRMVILDVPLLFESGLDRICHVTITVKCDDELQLKRLLKRNASMTETEAKQRISSQLSNNERAERADYVIDNSGSLEQLSSQVREVVDRVRPGFLSWIISTFPPFMIISTLVTYLKRSPKVKRD
jgi:dephospho-CoA kinase